MEKINLICIGNELLDGTTQDKNLFFLGKYLENKGISLNQSIFCTDTPKSIKKALSQSSGFTILSGGLGPTIDDRTKNSIASALDLDLNFSEPALTLIKKQFEEKNKKYNEKESHYHIIPDDFEAVYNESGFAPGLYSKKHQLFALPGVPSEFNSMLINFFPSIYQGSEVIEKIFYRSRGIIEKDIFFNLDPKLWEKLSVFGEVSSLPQRAGVDICIKIHGNNNQEIEDKKIQITKVISSSPINQYIWNVGNDSIENVVHKLLIENDLTIATAESCTGGMIANLLTKNSGSSQYFQGSVVAYQNRIKEDLLGISSKIIEDNGVVSKEVAIQMAKAVRKKFKSDFALATTGFLEVDHDFPHVWIALDSKTNSRTVLFKYFRNRESNKIVFAEQSLHLLREEIIKLQNGNIN